MNEHVHEAQMDAFFATLMTPRELLLPLADFECSGCGQIGRHDVGCPYEREEQRMAQTTTCKVDGCGSEAPRFGRYAGRCAEHRVAAVESNGNGNVADDRGPELLGDLLDVHHEEHVPEPGEYGYEEPDDHYPDQFGTDRKSVV